MNKPAFRRLAFPLAVAAALCASCGRDTVEPAVPGPGRSVAIVAGPTPSGAPPAAEQARYAASRFAGAWVRTDLDVAAWRVNLAKHATAEFAKQIAVSSPGDQPAQRLTRPVNLERSDKHEATYSVPTDTGTLRMVTVPIDYRWKIASAEHIP